MPVYVRKALLFRPAPPIALRFAAGGEAAAIMEYPPVKQSFTANRAAKPQIKMLTKKLITVIFFLSLSQQIFARPTRPRRSIC